MQAKAVLACVLLLAVIMVSADEHNKVYEYGEDVIIWVNSVSPFHNPSEAYNYYILPFCRGTEIVDHKHETLGEALLGYQLVNSGIGVRFRQDVDPKVMCSVMLTEDTAQQFDFAVLNQYWYDLHVDDLPMYGMVGEVVESASSGADETTYIYTHKRFSFSYNGERIIEANLTSENPEPIGAGVELKFTYSVEWRPTTTAFHDRWNKYLDNDFFEHQIHWFSIFNSFMMVIFLVGLVSMILMRTLRRDFARYARDEEDDFDIPLTDESGWKQVYGDVFRPPPNLALFSALIGTGYQLICLVFVVLGFAILGTMYMSRGTLLTTMIFCYAFTNIIAGYASGSFYQQNGGERWIRTMLLTATLFPFIVFSISLAVDFIAISYNSISAIPFTTMMAVILIWAFISFPLTLMGTMIGKNINGTPDVPFKPKPLPRQLPESRKWYLEPAVTITVAGLLPFGALFIEAYYILTSLWHHKHYYVYSLLLLVIVILIIVTVCVAIVVVYLILNAEDYRWHWIAFLSSSSTAGYVLVYSVYYFLVKTRMSGLLQGAIFFGYTGMACIAIGIFCGTVGFVGSQVFVKVIYDNIKVD